MREQTYTAQLEGELAEEDQKGRDEGNDNGTFIFEPD